MTTTTAATTAQLRFLEALLEQTGLTEQNLPADLADLDKKQASQLIDSLKHGRYGFPEACPTSPAALRILFLTHRATTNRDNPFHQFSATELSHWNRNNREHRDANRAWWKQQEAHTAQSAQNELDAIGTPRQRCATVWNDRQPYSWQQ